MAQPSSSISSDPDKTFISEHGRLLRPIEHKAFDPFRRRVIKIPFHIQLFQFLAAIILVPIRVFTVVFVTFNCYLISKVVGPPVIKEDLLAFKPVFIPAWRRNILRMLTQITSRAILFAIGFWTIDGRDAEGFDAKEAERATILSNHSSLADPCLLGYLFGPSFVAKLMLYNVPWIGYIGATQHAFYIDRVEGSKVSVTEKIGERQRLILESKLPLAPVAIFPEGTTTNGEHLLKFKTGAFVAGTPVAPVLFGFKSRWFSPAYDSIKTGKYLKGLLMQFASHVDYYRLPVYYPSEEEKKDPTLYADNVHKWMLENSEDAFGERLTSSDSDYIDKIEYLSIIRGTKLKKGLQLRMDT